MSSFPTPQPDSLLSVDTETVDGAMEVIRARGAVDLLTGPELERCVDDALDKRPSAIIVDLSDVDFLASFGMSILLRANQRLTGATRLVVVADGPATSRPMEILGLTDVLTICPTLQAARQRLCVGEE